MLYHEQLPKWFRENDGPKGPELLTVDVIAMQTMGWLTQPQGHALYQVASRKVAGDIVEIGSFHGRSTLFIALGAKHSNSKFYAIDPHKSIPEGGKEQFAPDKTPCEKGSYEGFCRTLEKAHLTQWVMAVVGTSVDVRPLLGNLKLKLLFIDGSHDFTDILLDYLLWSPLIVPHGYLVLHDSNFPTVSRVTDQYLDRARYTFIGTIGDGAMAMTIWERRRQRLRWWT
jgi:hypothetical protein